MAHRGLVHGCNHAIRSLARAWDISGRLASELLAIDLLLSHRVVALMCSNRVAVGVHSILHILVDLIGRPCVTWPLVRRIT